MTSGNFKEGDQVIVLGKLDQKVRDKKQDGLIKGTVFCLLRLEDSDVAVLLEDGTIWCGKFRDIRK